MTEYTNNEELVPTDDTNTVVDGGTAGTGGAGEVTSPPVESIVPLPHAEAVAYRESIIVGLKKGIPEVINSMVSYINDLVKSRSAEADPAVTISAELLSRASSKGGIYPAESKADIINQTANLFVKAGYDVTLVPTEDTQAVPTYILKLKK